MCGEGTAQGGGGDWRLSIVSRHRQTKVMSAVGEGCGEQSGRLRHALATEGRMERSVNGRG